MTENESRIERERERKRERAVLEGMKGQLKRSCTKSARTGALESIFGVILRAGGSGASP